MKLAISGKGGVGKTTISSALIKLFADSGRTVYAIDADPDTCLAAAIGIPDGEAEKIKPVVEMQEPIRNKVGQGAFYTLNPKVDDFIEEYSYKLGNIKFMRMGGVKKGGSSCYCRENTFLSAVITSLLLDHDDIVVMDMGAGIEHLSRGTSRGVDLMLVVVEPSKNSVNTANLVKKMAGEIGVKKVKIIANKIRSQQEKDFISKYFGEQEVVGYVGFSESIWENAMETANPVAFDHKLLDSLKEVSKRILSREV